MKAETTLSTVIFGLVIVAFFLMLNSCGQPDTFDNTQPCNKGANAYISKQVKAEYGNNICDHLPCSEDLELNAVYATKQDESCKATIFVKYID